MELIRVILGTTLTLAVIAVVGHGMWLVLRALFRSVAGNGDSLGDPGNRSASHTTSGTLASRIEADLQSARRLVDYANYRGWLSPKQLGDLKQLIADFTERVAGHEPKPPDSTAGSTAAQSATTQSATSQSVTAEPATNEQVGASGDASAPGRLPASTHSPKSTWSHSGQSQPAGPPQAVQPLHPLDEPDTIEPARRPNVPWHLAPELYTLGTDAGQAAQPAAPRKRAPLSANLMRAFMEQSNIRWIELISASLIIVCSVGLVISLWNTLSATSRYFPSLVFLLATAAVHAAGQYTLRKWKLRSTSRGILHIGLMLIPLAVLVGILLSDREGQPAGFDGMTITVILVGLAVYGGAAVTACRALFASRYLPVTVTTIVGAVTLIPIHYLGSWKWLGLPWSALTLVPLVAASLFTALALSETIRHQAAISGNRARRMATQVLQVVFATIVPAYFWMMRAEDLASISDPALCMAGLVMGGWASWGWTAGLAGPKPQGAAARPARERFQESVQVISQRPSEGTWLAIAAMGLACVCTLGLAAILWQTFGSRFLCAGFLLSLSAWWLCHGWRCGLLASWIAGSVTSMLAAGLIVEWSIPGSQADLQPVDWLRLPRIASLGLTALLSGVVGAGLWFWQRQSVAETSPHGPGALPIKARPSSHQLALSLLVGSALIIASTSILTLLASLLPWSQPAYGGNWAPLLLLLYGAAILGVGCALPRLVSVLPFEKVASWIVLAGQSVLLIGAVRCCQSAPMMPEWIADLRPLRDWSVGAGLLAVSWSGLACCLRGFDSRSARSMAEAGLSNSIHFLSLGGIGLALLSGLAYWTNRDELSLASSLGWIVPASFVFTFLALRTPAWREWSLVTTVGWFVSLLVWIGLCQAWWSSLGVAGSASLLVLAGLAVLGLYQFASRKGSGSGSWWVAGRQWAAPVLLQIGWLAVLLSLIFPVGLQFWDSLGTPWAITNRTGFLEAPLTITTSAGVLSVLLALSSLTIWLTSPKTDALGTWLAVVPICLAAIAGCNVSPPYCVPLSLWVLAAILVVLEVAPLVSVSTWKRLGPIGGWLSRAVPFSGSPWMETRHIGLGVMVSGTILLCLFHVVGRMPEPLKALTDDMTTWSGWLVNLSRILLWMAPLAVLLTTRWLTALWDSLPAVPISQRGYALGALLMVACVTAGAARPADVAILALQSFALIMAIIAWKTVSFATLWNWYGLRQVDKQAGPWQLMLKACEGSRWRKTEQAAWQLWSGSILAATGLSGLATVLVAVYPNSGLPEVHRAGSFWTLLSVGAATGTWWCLGPRRGMTKFGLLALTLGMIAPIVAAGYASWLMQHPESQFATANDFEPYRLLVSVWLASLALGLVMRVRAALHQQSLSAVGEMIWIGLAVVVSILMVRALPADRAWASSQLALLAVIIALSAEASGQAWRGWMAAIAGTLAWLPWISGGGSSTWLHFPWQALWGATGVGLVCIGSRLALQRFGSIHRAPAVHTPSARPRISVDRAATLLVSSLSIALSGAWILQQGERVAQPTSATWVVVGLVVGNLLLSVARLWDSGPSQRGIGVYLSVISAAVVLVNAATSYWQLPRLQAELAWLCGFLGAMTWMATFLREMTLQRIPLQEYFGWHDLLKADRLRQASAWMAGWHTVAALLCLFPSIWLVLNMPHVAGRLTAIALPMLGAAAILPVSIDRPRSFQRGCILLLISATLILAWWADLPAAWSMRQNRKSWLFVHRAFMACAVLGIVYPLIAWWRSLSAQLGSRSSSNHATASSVLAGDAQGVPSGDAWLPTLVKGGWVCLALAAAVGLGMIIGTTVGVWSDFPAGVSLVVKCLTLVAWSLLFGRLLQAAAVPLGVDLPAQLSTRTALVYAAELVLVSFGIATYQHFPYLFSGIFLQWWPLIVFGIALLSAGIGHLLQTARQPVLADPIHQSSLLLPLVPLAGVWWIRHDSPAAHWGEWGSYWVLLAAASCLYGLYGWSRGSTALRAISAVGALLSFWALLVSRPDMHFFQRPQVWLLPPAMGSLLYVEWNRRNLDAKMVVISRYFCVLVAYLSSSAELFLKSIEGNLWQPLILLVLALLGVMAGMLLRVRAFLYCGVIFILVALFGMVWHAAQAIDQVWPWWVFGIVTGVGLIVLLGYFEKNRPKVLSYLEELKSWQQ